MAATALGLGGPHEPFLKLVEGLLDDKDVEVRVTAIGSLADWKTRGAAPVLRKALNESVPKVSFAAARALFTLHDPPASQRSSPYSAAKTRCPPASSANRCATPSACSTPPHDPSGRSRLRSGPRPR